MTEDELLVKLRAQRARIQGNASMPITPIGVAEQYGVHPIEAQQLLQSLENRKELAVVARGDMWCLPEDEHRF